MIDLSSYKLRTQVTYDEYTAFISWYMKRSNIRVLKIKDRVGLRTVIDKKTKEPVCQQITKGYDTGYLIYDNFLEEYRGSL